MRLRAVFRWQGGKALSWQTLGLLLAWLLVVGLHLGNDGLWYQGDAPRHAANGLFWWDFLTRLPADPFDFALRYYARYPVIVPTIYPPVFYLLEGAAFQLFGASPFVAKNLVLAFALLAGLYLTAWLRRWVAPEAGWGAILFMLQPGVISWSNAVMLNIPAVALGLAALYHARRWLEAQSTSHLYAVVPLLFLTIFTYFPAGIVLFVILAWVIADRRWPPQALAFASLGGLVLIALTVMAVKWAPTHLSMVFAPAKWVLTLKYWTYYLRQLPILFDASVLALALLAVFLGPSRRGQLRRELKFALIWAAVSYLALSYILARDTRYALPLTPPLVILTVIGLLALARVATARTVLDPSRCFLVLLSAVLAFHFLRAPLVAVPHANGFLDVVAFLEREAPNERFFYDGFHNGIFSFYVRARDPEFRRGVVVGSKLLYDEARFRNGELVSSPSDVIDAFRHRCGCRWVVVEQWGGANRIAAATYLREVLRKGEEFQFVTSFPIDSWRSGRVDIYRFKPPVETPERIEFRLPALGDGTIYRAKPLER